MAVVKALPSNASTFGNVATQGGLSQCRFHLTTWATGLTSCINTACKLSQLQSNVRTLAVVRVDESFLIAFNETKLVLSKSQKTFASH